MQFQIPQFIEIESKIVGPLSLRQFLYLAGAGAISFVSFFIFDLWLWFFITAILGAIAIALAFIKYNGQSLPKIIYSAFFFFWQPKFYLWQREVIEKTVEVQQTRKNLQEYLPTMPSVKKLWQDLMTTKKPIPKREKILASYWGRKPKERFQLFRKLSGAREIARRIDYR
jgi:hypothetical protein